MKLKDLFEMPQLIDDINWITLEDPTKNRNFFDKCNSPLYEGKKKLFDINEYSSVYYAEKQKNYFCLDFKAKKITYYMEYQVGDDKVLQEFVYQSLVWTDSTISESYIEEQKYAYLRGLPEKIFFNYLLKEYETIVTDSEQTFKGKRFWENRISDAFKKNLNVYFFDFKSKEPVKLLLPEDLKNFQKLYDIWGPDDLHLAKRMVISRENLK